MASGGWSIWSFLWYDPAVPWRTSRCQSLLFKVPASHFALCSIERRLQFAMFLLPPPCSSASSGSRWCTVALLSLRRLQTSLIVPGSREIRLHSKAELAFPPPPVIRRQVATVTSSLQKFPSTAPLQIPVCSTSPFHVWKATTSPAVFFVKLSRESKPSLFLNFSHCIYIYIYFFSRNQKQLWSSVQGKFSSSPPRLVWKLCFHRFKKEVQILDKGRNGTAASPFAVI